MRSVSTRGDKSETVQIQQPISPEEGLCTISHCALLPGLAFSLSSSTKVSTGKAGRFKLKTSSNPEQEDAVEDSHSLQSLDSIPAPFLSLPGGPGTEQGLCLSAAQSPPGTVVLRVTNSTGEDNAVFHDSCVSSAFLMSIHARSLIRLMQMSF